MWGWIIVGVWLAASVGVTVLAFVQKWKLEEKP